MQYPTVETRPDLLWPLFHSIMDMPYALLPHVVDERRETVTTLLRQADLWEQAGYRSNASFWRKNARVVQLDMYRMGVELGCTEEDEELESEIHALIGDKV